MFRLKIFRLLAVSDEKLIKHIGFSSFVHATQYHEGFLWVALNPEVRLELSPNLQDITIWDKTNANRRIGLNHCEAMSKELRIDILRLPTRNSEEPIFRRSLELKIYWPLSLLALF